MRRTLAAVTVVALLVSMVAFTLPVLATGDDAPGNPDHKILICHLPPGNPDNGQVIEIDKSAWDQGGPPGHHGPGLHGGDFEITSEDDLKKCEGKDTTTTKQTTTTKHETTTTKKDDSTTTTRKDETTTTKRETTTTKRDDTTTTKHGETTTSKDSTTTTEGSTTTRPTSTTSTSTTEPPVVTPFCVDVNNATQAELELLDGIPPVLAFLIIVNRPYDSVQDLLDILPPGVLALILATNAQTGAFASDDCLTPVQTGATNICHRFDSGVFVLLPIDDDPVIIEAHLAHGDIYPVPPEGCPNIITTTSTSTTSTTSTTTSSTIPGETTTTESTTTTSTIPGETTTTESTTTTSTIPGETTTTVPFVFGAAATVCVAEVPTIRITFANTFPELAGQTGVLTMADINGNVVSTQPLVYQPGTTVDLLYPGTSVNPDGSIDDVPGWILTDDGLWIRDPSDEFLREGINLTYTVNPTATAFITYPPESSACANPENPPGTTTPDDGILTIPTTPRNVTGILPLTGDEFEALGIVAGLVFLLGLVILVSTHQGRLDEDESARLLG